MIVRHWLRIVALLALSSVAGPALAQATEADGLVKVTPRKMEMAWLRPGADFRPYTKVMVDKTQVAFLPNWRKDYNLNAAVGNWVSEAQANQIMAVAQTNFDQVFADAFKKAGYEVVTTTGPDVLRINSAILDLSVNAPLGGSTGQTNWIISAGEAALIIEVRDSTTNALLGRVADRRETQYLGRQLATTATNIYDFRNLFGLWAGICVNALADVKAASPIPKNLQPGQSL
jgi:mannose/fructose/N-acetylgalactosamine-specific phosphotransferase system component IIB